MNENLIGFFTKRQDIFPLSRPLDLQRFLADAIDRPLDSLPTPAKIFLADELDLYAYGFPVTKSSVLDELEQRLGKWISEEIASRKGGLVDLSTSYATALAVPPRVRQLRTVARSRAGRTGFPRA